MKITRIIKINKSKSGRNQVVLTEDFTSLSVDIFDKVELDFLKNIEAGEEIKIVNFNHGAYQTFFIRVSKKGSEFQIKEAFRLAGAKLNLGDFKIKELVVTDLTTTKGGLYFAEGLILASYKFDKYKSEAKPNPLEIIVIDNKEVTEREVDLINITNEATYHCRNLSNEPQSTLNSITMANEFRKLCDDSGARIEVFNKKKIESLKMGGLLAVNKGSVIEPTFSLMTWKPDDAINSEPYIFVGKGVVFDTGGLNIKTGDFMYDMRYDMAGAAAAASAFWAVAKAKLPIYLIAIIPATDNRPGGHAYAPGDIIKMHNGKSVEVINTDAEGRMILADALSYASRFKPKMVIDLATLTGAAARAVGKYATAAMQNEDCKNYELLAQAGDEVYERLVEFPLWEEYGESIKSEFADIKNLGGAEAGMISAGKFLEHFVNYPWVHLDIAGPSILSANHGYRTKGGSGVGTRILFEFIKNITENK